MAKLGFDGFKIEVIRAMKEKYSEENVRVVPVTKNNNLHLTGLAVSVPNSAGSKEGVGEICPTVYLEYMYGDYEKGMSFEEVIENATKVIEENLDCSTEIIETLGVIMDFDTIKRFIFPCVVNTELNSETLGEVPHRQFLDLSIVYKLYFDRDMPKLASLLIRDRLLKMWDITEDQLYEAAMENLLAEDKMINLPIVCDMATVLDSMSDGGVYRLLSREEIERRMWLVSNRCTHFGATVMLNQKFMKELYKGFGQEMIIIPSSVNEIIVLTEEDACLDELNERIEEVNTESVQRNEILSNHYYRLTENGVSL